MTVVPFVENRISPLHAARALGAVATDTPITAQASPIVAIRLLSFCVCVCVLWSHGLAFPSLELTRRFVTGEVTLALIPQIHKAPKRYDKVTVIRLSQNWPR